jgi:hypothetical protein
MKINLRWSSYVLIVAFSTYWFVNLLLWYPWSYDTRLGITLMLTAILPVWIYSVYHCLKRHDGERLVHGAFFIFLIFTFVAIVLDYFFYGIIRGAMAELYHPTTFYGYAFLTVLPFVEMTFLNKMLRLKKPLKNIDFIKSGLPGFISFILILLIVKFDIKIVESTFKFITFILASLLVFNIVMWSVLGLHKYKSKLNPIILLSIICVIIGMLIGKFGADLGLKWWIYYSVPMLMTILLPPMVLKMGNKQIMIYLLLSIVSAPFLHATFSFFFNWSEYMPFLEIPHYKAFFH